jgi:1,2-diacylglycerol 3-alpha-glucosyltransferase
VRIEVMLNVALCTPMFYPAVGGAETATMKLADGLARLGHRVVVLTFNSTNVDYRWGIVKPTCEMGLPTREVVDRVTILRFPYTYPLSSSLTFSLPQEVALGSLDADLLHIQGFVHIPNILLMARHAKSLKLPVVLTTHGYFESMLRLQKYGLNRVFIPLISNSVSSFIALSDAERSHLVQAGVSPSKVMVIPNGVDTQAMQDGTRRVPIRYSFGDLPFVLCVARFARNKDLETLIRAFSQVRDDIGLIMAGYSSDVSYLNELVKDNSDSRVHFLANVSDEELRWLYHQALLTVLPSRVETSPLAVLEAMAAGKPVIASEVGAVKEIIHDGENGFKFKPGNVQELSRLISQLLQDTSLRLRLGRFAMTFAQSRSWERNTHATLDLYNRLL